jgi:glutathione peroxidase
MNKNIAGTSALVLALGATLAGCSQAGQGSSNSDVADKSPAAAERSPVIDHVVESIDGKEVDLASLRGRSLLIVNTASECGYTPQYADLQELHRSYEARGFSVLAFPSNDFGGQEPGDHAAIKEFTAENFEITFPLFSKVHARGPDISPLFRTLTEQTADPIRGPVKWNFTKFLVDPEGRVVARFDSSTRPTDDVVRAAIERTLPKKG